MSDSVTAATRTIVAYVVGLTVAWLASRGVTVPDEVKTVATAFVATVAGFLYSFAVNWAQRRFPESTVIGRLLLVRRVGVYVTPTVANEVQAAKKA